jgi:hypothetical protein
MDIITAMAAVTNVLIIVFSFLAESLGLSVTSIVHTKVVAENVVRLAGLDGDGERLALTAVSAVIPAKAGIQELDPGSSPG